MAHSGVFKPRNPQKYIGDTSKIIFRSSWELRAFNFCDLNINVLRWASEEIAIPYVKPTDKKIHQYFPDLFIEAKTLSGGIKRFIIEIKPEKEASAMSAKSLYDKLSLVINRAKWEAAVAFCKRNNIEFKVLTERQLFKGGI
jgi:hypothetical protein